MAALEISIVRYMMSEGRLMEYEAGYRKVTDNDRGKSEDVQDVNAAIE